MWKGYWSDGQTGKKVCDTFQMLFAYRFQSFQSRPMEGAEVGLALLFLLDVLHVPTNGKDQKNCGRGKILT